MHPEHRKCMDAYARGILPLQPGDVVYFLPSGARTYVIASTKQEVQDAQPGQRLYGMIVLSNKRYHWHEFFIEWRGYDGTWTFVRPRV